MKSFVTALVFVFASAGVALAGDMDYDDPGMHYSPPAGWEKIPVPQDAQGQGGDDDKPPVAVYAFHRGQSDQRTIVISIQDFDGSLDEFDRSHESDVRKGAEGTFVDKPIKTALANGMPVYLLKVSTGSEAGNFVQRFEYLMIDGTRSIDVSYSGRQGDFSQKDAVDAFSTLYVVAYPRHRD
jgi:hypothetical protein